MAAPPRERIALDDIEIGSRFRADLGDTVPLMRSMDSVGLLHPIVLDGAHKLIAGRRRLEAARRLGWETIPYVVAESVTTAEKYLIAERDENTCRVDMTPSEKVALGKALEELERPKAAERKAQKPGGKQGEKVSSENFTGEKGDTRDIIGKAIGMSGPTYSRAKVVVDAAAADPATHWAAKEEMDRTGKVTPAFEKVTGQKTNKGGHGKREKRPEQKLDDNGEPQRIGVGVMRANEAINCLIRIPKNDPLRKRGFQIVTDWIKANK